MSHFGHLAGRSDDTGGHASCTLSAPCCFLMWAFKTLLLLNVSPQSRQGGSGSGTSIVSPSKHLYCFDTSSSSLVSSDCTHLWLWYPVTEKKCLLHSSQGIIPSFTFGVELINFPSSLRILSQSTSFSWSSSCFVSDQSGSSSAGVSFNGLGFLAFLFVFGGAEFCGLDRSPLMPTSPSGDGTPEYRKCNYI